MHADVIVVGAGIVGTTAALHLAEAGVRVTVLDSGKLGAGASGRNAGSVQHPFDASRASLYHESVTIYRRFGLLDDAPAGLLAVGSPAAASSAMRAASCGDGLEPMLLDPDALRSLEPGLRPGLYGCLMRTGYPAFPGRATALFAEHAKQAGAAIEEGARATLEFSGDRVTGVRTPAGVLHAEQVLVAAGAWSSELIDPSGAWRPISALWGVTVEISPALPVRHRIEEWLDEGESDDLQEGAHFEATPFERSVVLGASRSLKAPAEAAGEWAIIERAARFMPSVAQAAPIATRICPRPAVARDGMPLLGAVTGFRGLHIAAGHGAYGISLGPASGRMAAEALLGEQPVAASFRASRFGAPPLPAMV